MDWSFSKSNGSNLSFDDSWKRLSFPTFNNKNNNNNIKDVENIPIGWIGQYDASQVPRAGDEACKRACYLMMETAGFKPQRGMVNGYYIARENSEVISVLPDSNKGLEYLNRQLIAGTPVIVGVARDKNGYRTRNQNGDGTTDHFIIIYGVHKGAYRFLDPGTQNQSTGSSQNNLLKLQPNGIYAGNRAGQRYNLMMSWIGKNY